MTRRSRVLAVIAAVAGCAALADSPARAATFHDPYTSSVGVYVQSYGDDTTMRINCSRGQLDGIHGDGTLFMENTPPGLVICFIVIRPPD